MNNLVEKSRFDKLFTEQDEGVFLGKFSTLCGENIDFYLKIEDGKVIDLAYQTIGSRVFYIASDCLCLLILNEKIEFLDLEKLLFNFWKNYPLKLIGQRKELIENLIKDIYKKLLNLN